MPRPVHFEIRAAKPEAAISFYSDLFGWSFQRWGDQAYWVISTGTDGPGIDGGLVQRRGPSAAPDAETPVVAFVCTVSVPDTAQAVSKAVSKAVSLGGTVALARHAVPGVGWLAYCKDRDGNIFGVMTQDPTAA